MGSYHNKKFMAPASNTSRSNPALHLNISQVTITRTCKDGVLPQTKIHGTLTVQKRREGKEKDA
jgi:hypothetical protein